MYKKKLYINTRELNFRSSFVIVCTAQGSDEFAQMRKINRAFASRLCDRYKSSCAGPYLLSLLKIGDIFVWFDLRVRSFKNKCAKNNCSTIPGKINK